MLQYVVSPRLGSSVAFLGHQCGDKESDRGSKTRVCHAHERDLWDENRQHGAQPDSHGDVEKGISHEWQLFLRTTEFPRGEKARQLQVLRKGYRRALGTCFSYVRLIHHQIVILPLE